jgi:hypothetical protein
LRSGSWNGGLAHIARGVSLAVATAAATSTRAATVVRRRGLARAFVRWACASTDGRCRLRA